VYIVVCTLYLQVYIVAHVPPGMFELGDSISWFYAAYNKKYLEVMEKYQDVIAVQLYGHEHTDSFRLQFDKEGMIEESNGYSYSCFNVCLFKINIY